LPRSFLKNSTGRFPAGILGKHEKTIITPPVKQWGRVIIRALSFNDIPFLFALIASYRSQGTRWHCHGPSASFPGQPRYFKLSLQVSTLPSATIGWSGMLNYPAEMNIFFVWYGNYLFATRVVRSYSIIPGGSTQDKILWPIAQSKINMK
jgi:hypothetical protein